ncbi:MAG: hypothetical protein ACRDOE_09195, partial [Streptosporangiaceae bacterium]
VLLFARLDVLGVAWLRIASAALVFALWRRPGRIARRLSPEDRRALLGLGVLLATITAIRITGQPLGFVFAFANCGLFMLYVSCCARSPPSRTSRASPW